MRILLASLIVSLTVSTALAGAAVDDEKPLKSRIEWVGLFKNGLGVVQRTVRLPGPGTYRIDSVPEPVHGTYWIESDAKIVTRLTTRVVEAPAGRSTGTDLQQELAGKQVDVYFGDPNVGVVRGRVAEVAPPRGEDAWNRNYQQPRYGYPYNSGRGPSGAGRMLVVETETGRAYVDTSKIAYLHASGAAGTVKRREPVLLLTLAEAKKEPVTVRISYLAKGLSWAPSYRVDISDPKTLVVRQKAVVKNELEDIDRAEFRLISGYPGVRFAHVTSPLSLRTTWTNFFGQLNRRIQPQHASLTNVAYQQAVSFNEPSPVHGIDLSAIPSGEGVDLHYQEIGRQTLDEGDSLAVDVTRGEAAYDRIVEWIVPDTRRADGRRIEEHQRNQDPEKYQDAVWDAVRFRNPLSFPMTTGPAMIVSGERFNGQCTSYWVNPGEETTLQITKALSVRTRSVEHEVEHEREIIHYGGHAYRKVAVKGELSANNHRKEAVSLVIRCRFSGDLTHADGKPLSTLLEEGVYSVNKRNQLTWSVTLDPGKEVRLEYRYDVLVRH